MTKTKYTGVYYHIAKDGNKTFHIRGKINGKNYTEVVGSTKEGVTAMYASQMRAKKHSVIKLGEDSPLHKKMIFTLDQAAALYFDHINHKRNTKNAFEVYHKHLSKPFGSLEMEDITVNSLSLYKNQKLQEKIVRRIKGGRLKPLNRTYSQTTINKHLDLISGIYSYMRKYHNIKIDNPAQGVERFKINNKRERYLDGDEVAALLNEIRTNPSLRKREMLELFTLLAVTTGARVTGILSIKKQDINLSTGTIRLTDFKRGDMTYTGYIHSSVREKLEGAMDGLRPIDYVIGSSSKPKHKDSIAKMLQPLLNKLFNQDLEPDDFQRRAVIHTLRHTFASQLAIAGVPIFTIQKLMNHKEISMTMRYSKLMPDQGREDIANIKV